MDVGSGAGCRENAGLAGAGADRNRAPRIIADRLYPVGDQGAEKAFNQGAIGAKLRQVSSKVQYDRDFSDVDHLRARVDTTFLVSRNRATRGQRPNVPRDLTTRAAARVVGYAEYPRW